MPTIAVLGASRDRRKYGNKCVRAYAQAGYDVFPVHPTENEIEGRAVFKSLAQVPQPLDRVSVYLPPAITLGLLDELATTDVREIWLNPGSADDTVLHAAQRLELPIRPGCSIIDIGVWPALFPDS
jgi:uncharacterized protein